MPAHSRHPMVGTALVPQTALIAFKKIKKNLRN